MATIYKRGDVYYLNWSQDGRQQRFSLGKITAREAEKIRSQKEAELEHGVRIIARLPTVNAFLDSYLDWYKAEHPTTHKKAKSEFKAFCAAFGNRPIDKVRPAEVEVWKADRLSTMSRETVGKEIRRLNTAFKRGIAWEELDANPIARVSAPRGVRSVAVKFYSQADMKKLGSTNRGELWRFMAMTGLRRSEAARVVKSRDVVRVGKEQRLRIESVPDETGVGRTKSGKWREVPLNALALKCLKNLPDRIAPAHPDTLSGWFAEDAEAADVGGTLHRLRHTFCAHLAMAGVSLRRIQLLAGHAHYSTTEMYAHLAPEGAQGAVDKLKF